VPFAQDAAVAADQVDAQNAAVFQLQSEREPDPIGRIAGGIEINGTFNPMNAGNRQTGVLHEALVAGDRVFDGAECRTIQDQFSAAGKFFDKFHHLPLITRLSRTIQ
jgi:hypothetical protein